MTIERHGSHPPGVICRPAGSGLCEPFIPSKVPDLSRVPLDLIPALGEDEGPSFSSSV